MGGPLWPLPGWFSRGVWSRWWRASIGSREKGLPPELTRLRSILQAGLTATAALWAPVEAAYDWVFRAAAILANLAGKGGAAVQASYRGLLGAMARHGAGAGNLAGAVEHFRKVTRS